jgi:hypothetical protein
MTEADEPNLFNFRVQSCGCISVATYMPEEHLGKPLLNERFDWLK